jgi:hypothetical protein
LVAPRLLHFSDDPGITRFVPRAVQVASARPTGREWLNGPLVWAIEASHQYLYLFPRECPRIVVWACPDTTAEDRTAWLGDNHVVAYIEAAWLERLRTAELTRYTLDPEGFEDLADAGMWVSRQTADIIERTRLVDLPDALAGQGVTLRVVDSLLPLRPVWDTSLHASGIRLRNARGWPAEQGAPPLNSPR